MKGPIDGIKVIECGHWMVAPIAGSILGDLGADVIKIEERGRGDLMRGLTHISGQKVEKNFLIEFSNRSTRGIALDLKKEGGREIVYKLIEQTDVFIHNFQAGIPEKLGLDYETLSHHNPRLIYGQGSAWGPEGPDRGKPGYAPLMEARSGLTRLLMYPGTPPIPLPNAFGDIITAITLVLAILAALLSRERSGIGQKVDVSGLGSLMALEMTALHAFFVGGREEQRMARPNVGNPLWYNYECADGKWICLNMLQADRYWHTFCEAMGIKQLEKDPRFENFAVRKENAEEFIDILAKIFFTRPRSEWLQHFENQAELVYGPVQSIPELSADSQVVANEYLIDFNHPVYGMMKILGFPYKFSRTPASVKGPAPELGQHTEEVLLEMGYDWEHIIKMKDEEII